MDLGNALEKFKQGFFQTEHGLVYGLILQYDKQAAQLKEVKQVKRPPLQVLKTTAVWTHFSRVKVLADSLKIKASTFLQAQFEYTGGTFLLQPPMLYSAKAVQRYHEWAKKKVSTYNASFKAAAEAVIQADPTVMVRHALAVGYKQWLKMSKPALVQLAQTMPNLLPSYFLLTDPNVVKLLDDNILTSDILITALAEVRTMPSVWLTIKNWKPDVR